MSYRFPAVACLFLLASLVALAPRPIAAHVGLIAQLEPVPDSGRVALVVRIDNRGGDTIASYAMRLWLAPGAVRYVSGSARDGGEGFGAGPFVNDLGGELRVSGCSTRSTLVSGALFRLDLALYGPANGPLVLVEDYGQDALISDTYAVLPHWYDLSLLARVPEWAPVATREPEIPQATPQPAEVYHKGTPYPTVGLIASDANHDCRTDVIDAAIVLDALGAAPRQEGTDPDVDGDGDVDTRDLAACLERMGQRTGNCPEPEPAPPAQPAVVFAYQRSPDAGGVFEVGVEALDAGALRGYQLTLAFDAKQVEYMNATADQALDRGEANSVVTATVQESGLVHVVAVRLSKDAVTPAGALATLLFRVQGGGPARVTLHEALLIDENVLPRTVLVD